MQRAWGMFTVCAGIPRDIPGGTRQRNCERRHQSAERLSSCLTCKWISSIRPDGCRFHAIRSLQCWQPPTGRSLPRKVGIWQQPTSATNTVSGTFPAIGFASGAAMKNSFGSALDPLVTRIAGAPYFAKHRGDAFSNDALERFLVSNDIGRVVLAGVYADACIYCTARSAINRGYPRDSARRCGGCRRRSGSTRGTPIAVTARGRGRDGRRF